ncbi:hypothetical protein ACFQZX_07675 [Mucilaginibacter litoreus]|uniref:Uncharacterized protein n=1 Tax=Mucilaginibacter litoreus TaxID=1048221 RepID=A0ABW3AR72_9SPHI
MINYGFTSITIFNIYTIFEFAFIAAFYATFYRENIRKIIYVLMFLFGILVIINYLFIQNGYEFNTYTRPLEAIMIIGFAITFILKQNSDEQSWGDNKNNWINSGILIYYSSGLAMFIFTNHLLHASRSINNFVWYVHDTILMFEYILFAVGFYKCKPQTITSTY